MKNQDGGLKVPLFDLNQCHVRCQNLIGSYASTHSMLNLIGPTTNTWLYKPTKPQRYIHSNHWHMSNFFKIAQKSIWIFFHFFLFSISFFLPFCPISFTGHLVHSPQFLSPFLLGSWQDLNQCVVPENIHTTPTERIRFSRGEGGGVNLPNFPVGRGGSR